MEKKLKKIVISFVLLVYVVCEVSAEESTQELYDKRIELLTGSTTPPTCKKDTEDFNECLKRTLLLVQSHILNGVPELNIPPSEPIKLNTTSFNFKVGVASGRLQLKNAEIYGTSVLDLKNIDFKVENGATRSTSELFIPKLRIVGDYRAVVTLNNRFNFKPQGTFNLTVYDINVKLKTEGRLVERDGHEFVQLNKVQADPQIGDIDIDVTGIFDDPELNEFALSVGKQYWREIYRIMLPVAHEHWAPMVMRLLNETLGLIPYDAFIKEE